ncbi:methionine--tRNA ligase [Candidatus Aerophobetes bacterium]|uniref:Methionine--tRNA ligase n=1 Tax=Aerophobetes bacterium TaxID=2030807 RepID=A0A497E2A3_UNCAE|nr:MAG: methionine--tRNA ligase [Candidatus Aerophobetes bacterium]
MTDKFYLTTPLYYVNDVPHIGHAYTTIAADVLARYKRLRGYKVFFLTGTDEHGNKIARAAKERGLSPEELADSVVKRFQNLWGKLYISYDDFIRTTESRHTKVVEKVFLRLYEQKDIYKGFYEGWYCVPCESFWLESQLAEGSLCPECKRPVERVKEESYFFRLSKYQDQLLNYIEKNPDFVLPPTRRNEVVEFIKRGLRDISVTRLRLEWGIPCPVEKKHTIYVWIDALLNYISALGYSLDGEKFSLFWPADVQLVGKDILKFHAIIWPALLMALGIKPPRKVFAHGWWMVKGEKMSKSRGNVISPEELVERYGADPLRYFLLREVPFGEDGNFSPSLFIKRVNSDLANDLGNLLNRTLPLVERYCEGKVPCPAEERAEDAELREKVRQVVLRLDELMNGLAFSEALSLIWEIIRFANLYIDRSAPWRLAKEGKKERLSTVLYYLLETLRVVSLLVFPFIPRSAERIWAQLGLEDKLSEKRWDEVERWGILPSGIRVRRKAPLFPRIKE